MAMLEGENALELDQCVHEKMKETELDFKFFFF